MRGTKAKRLRREARERGDLPTKRLFAPVLTPMPKINHETGEKEIEETYIPRRQRRWMYRKLMTDLRKGRINLQNLGAKNDRTK